MKLQAGLACSSQHESARRARGPRLARTCRVKAAHVTVGMYA